LGAWLRGRLRVLEGDVEKPRFGLDRSAWEALQADPPDLLLHCAGLTDFMPDPVKALATNTLGARHAGDVAARLGCPLLHVSTCYTAGQQEGEIPEALEVGRSPSGQRFDAAALLAELQAYCRSPEGLDRRRRTAFVAARARELGWPNLYTFSKGLAEHLLLGRQDLRVVVARPAIVECARSFPFEGWNEGINTAGPLAWLISTAFRRFPTVPDHPFDVVPVDDVARGLLLIAGAMVRGPTSPVFQLASSATNPLTFGRAVELTGLAWRRQVRRQGGTPWERVTAWLDPIPTPAERPGPLAVDRLRRLVGTTRRAMDRWSPEALLPPAMVEALDLEQGWRPQWRSRLEEADQQLAKVETMLELYKPFVHDLRQVFPAEHLAALPAEAPTGDPALRLAWTVDEIDWRAYWVEVEYPGLATWCMPLLRGEQAPQDPPWAQPLSWEDAAAPAPPMASRRVSGSDSGSANSLASK
jgi:long-chain acyl-CoA synthetase